MIIGNGLLAKSFSEINDPIFTDWIIFASGVSDSSETRVSQFKRERDLLIKTLKENNGLNFIYFSSVLVGLSDKPYYQHKLEMENLVKSELCNYIIFRIPQIVGENGNSNNIFNHFQDKIKNNGLNIIYDGIERALVDIDDLITLVSYSVKNVIDDTVVLSHIEKVSVLDLCNKIGEKLSITPIICEKPRPSKYEYSAGNWNLENSKVVTDWLTNINTVDYTDKIINKYIKK